MYYPEELIEEIRAKNDIVEVISGYVRLQKNLRFPYPARNKCTIVSGAGRAAT